MVPSLLDREETELLVRVAHDDGPIREQAVLDHVDPNGNSVQLTAWNHPGDDIYGKISRCDRVVTAIERILDDEVYHYPSKVVLKEAQDGGAWEWHQDYGYWYHNGCLYPDMVSVSIAIDPATRKNGCMQLLRGSQKMGRIEHGEYDGQFGADPQRTGHAIRRLEIVHSEMKPGDALFFHANTLHRSDANTTNDPRWSLICCYNARRNDPYKDSIHPRYTPLEKVTDRTVREFGMLTSDPHKRFVSAEDEGGDT